MSEEEQKKTKLPLKIKVKDEGSDQLLELERQQFEHKGISVIFGHLSAYTGLAVNDLYLTSDPMSGKFRSIEGKGISSDYFFDSFHLPEDYVVNELRISFYPKERSYKEDCEWVKNHLDNFTPESEDFSDESFHFPTIYKAIKSQYPFIMDFYESDQFMNVRMPIDKKIFDRLCSEISSKAMPKIYFNLAFPNAYKLTSYHPGHAHDNYLYLLPKGDRNSVMGIADIGDIHSHRKEDLEFGSSGPKKLFLRKKKNSDEEIAQRLNHATDDNSEKILLQLMFMNKKAKETNQAVIIGMAIVILLLIFH